MAAAAPAKRLADSLSTLHRFSVVLGFPDRESRTNEDSSAEPEHERSHSVQVQVTAKVVQGDADKHK
jgi:hypothetical protein